MSLPEKYRYLWPFSEISSGVHDSTQFSDLVAIFEKKLNTDFTRVNHRQDLDGFNFITNSFSFSQILNSNVYFSTNFFKAVTSSFGIYIIISTRVYTSILRPNVSPNFTGVWMMVAWLCLNNFTLKQRMKIFHCMVFYFIETRSYVLTVEHRCFAFQRYVL